MMRHASLIVRASLIAAAIVLPSPTNAARSHNGKIAVQVTAGSGQDCQPSADGICLAVGVAIADPGDADACATATSLVANIGDQLNYCYTVTNHSTTTLQFHTLVDSIDGVIFYGQAISLATGESYSYHRYATAIASGNHELTWTAQDAPNSYVPDDQATYAFIDISATGMPHPDIMEDWGKPVDMPFAFQLYGQVSNHLCIANDGGITLGVDRPNDCVVAIPQINTALPTDAGWLVPADYPRIFPYWDNLGNTGEVYTQTLGEAPNRRFIVQWQAKDHYPGDWYPIDCQVSGDITFEAILGEDGSLSFQYQDTTFTGDSVCDNGGGATVGVQDAGRSLFYQYLYNQPLLHDGMAIEWNPGPATRYSAIAGVALDVGAPSIRATPDTLSATAVFAEPITRTLSIDNVGDRDLVWSVYDGTSARNLPARRVVRSVGKTDGQERFQRFPPRGAVPDAPRYRPSAAASPLDSLVPAYAISLGYYTGMAAYVGFDAAAPESLQTVTNGSYDGYWVGAFANNDFSKEFIVNDTTGLHTIDTTTGEIVAVGPTEGDSGGWWGLASDPNNGTLYGLTCTIGDNELLTINTITGASTRLGEITGVPPATGCFTSIVIDRDGTFYAIFDTDDGLYMIDRASLEARYIGSLGFDTVYSTSLAFDYATATLYLASPSVDADGFLESHMYTVDTATGLATEISGIGTVYNLYIGMAIAKPSTQCTDPADVPWLSLGATSGTIGPDGSADIVVGMDPQGLADGSYSTELCLRSNDLLHPVVGVPIEFVVSHDGVFHDGFDNFSR